MDMNKLIKSINNLRDYASATENAGDLQNTKIQFNMSSILALKKIRSFEIEYFNKHEENGIAVALFRNLVEFRPSKTWTVLGKELVTLLQYWLDALRKHLITHNPRWWTFLKVHLKLLKEIRVKDPSLPNCIVENTAECLLDLSTNSQADAFQRTDILHCLNNICAESSREIRFALRNRFESYFIKLSTYMAQCGYLPCQFVILETLLRWLVPRNQPELRAMSAAQWFPDDMFARATVDIFLERPWLNFFQDARDFLNIHNGGTGLIMSVICKKLCIGKVVVISGTEKQQTFLDINTTGRCLSVLLDPQILGKFGSKQKSCETIIITNDDMQTIVLKRESQKPVISITTLFPPCAHPSMIDIGDGNNVDIVISSCTDTKTLDTILRSILDDKYQLLLDFNDDGSTSQSFLQNDNRGTCSEEDTRFSHPIEIRHRKRSGYVVKSNRPHAWKSPSTASTSSLAQLHDKLAALPPYKYDKEPVSVCAQPALSTVTEVSEIDDKHSLHSANTFKLTSYGVCTKNKSNIRKSQSAGDVTIPKQHSPALKGNSTSCLLVATVGSADDSIINDTIERLSKSKDFNPDSIVDLLVKEALHVTEKDLADDSGVITGDKKTDVDQESCDSIDNTPFADAVIDYQNVTKKKGCVVISNSSTEKSIDNENFVNQRTKETVECSRTEGPTTFNVDEVELFFNQHVTQNAQGDVMVSPTLAKRINRSSSDSSFEDFIKLNEEADDEVIFNKQDVLGCLNDMVDKVCSDFDTCTEYLKQPDPVLEVSENIDSRKLKYNDKNKKVEKASKKGIKLKFKFNTQEETKVSKKGAAKKDKAEKSDKSKNQTNKRQPRTLKSKITENLEINSETNSEVNEKENIPDVNKTPVTGNDEKRISTPLLRRKRKLYSPKDETVGTAKTPMILSDSEEEIALSKLKTTKIYTPKFKATSYKDIEKERKKHIRQPRNRKSKSKVELPSPRSMKLNKMFDKLKETVESNETIKLAEKSSKRTDIYNFTSDSEDDFVPTKVTIAKRNSGTTVGSIDSTVTTRSKRPRKRINYNEDATKKTTKSKKAVNKKPKVNVPIDRDMVDERMRKATVEDLNTSLIEENPEKENIEPELVLEEAPKMEVIEEPVSTKTTKKRSKKIDLSLKKKPANLNTLEVVSVGNRTESPLPNLVIESVPQKEEGKALVSDKMLLKFKNIHEGKESQANDTNTTQNLVSDLERNDYNTCANDLVYVNEYFSYETDSEKSQRQDQKQRKMKPENLSDVSIVTDGITGHGVEDESPPTVDKEFQTRKIGIDDLDQTMQEYFEQLDRKVNDIDRNSVTSGSEIRQPRVRLERLSSEEITKISEKSDHSNSISKSPTVSISRIPSFELNKWLQPQENKKEDTKHEKSTEKSYNLRKLLPSRESSVEISNKTKSNTFVRDYRLRSREISFTSSIDEINLTKMKSVDQNTEVVSIKKSNTRASLISPVKLGLTFNINKKKQKSESTQSNDCVQRIKDIISEGKIQKTTTVSKIDLVSQESVSTRITSNRKRKVVEDENDLKRLKFDAIESVESVPSTCSVTEWLRRNEISSREDTTTLSVIDSVQNILEKLDTTLADANKDTSRKFVYLFVEAQKQFAIEKEKRMKMYHREIEATISQFWSLLNNKLAELERRSEEMENTFMENLREKASEIIINDCKKKQAIVQIMKEDFTTVLEHLNKRNT